MNLDSSASLSTDNQFLRPSNYHKRVNDSTIDTMKELSLCFLTEGTLENISRQPYTVQLETAEVQREPLTHLRTHS